MCFFVIYTFFIEKEKIDFVILRSFPEEIPIMIKYD